MHEAFLALYGRVDRTAVGVTCVFQDWRDTAARPRVPRPPSRARPRTFFLQTEVVGVCGGCAITAERHVGGKGSCSVCD